jgi:hypothetical protein
MLTVPGAGPVRAFAIYLADGDDRLDVGVIGDIGQKPGTLCFEGVFELFHGGEHDVTEPYVRRRSVAGASEALIYAHTLKAVGRRA